LEQQIMRKQHTKVICAALLAASLTALGLASAALDRIGATGPFSFVEGRDAENHSPNPMIHIGGVTESKKVHPVLNKSFLGSSSVLSETRGTRSENNNRGNEFCEQIQLIGCPA
jgi:hypothetical protein